MTKAKIYYHDIGDYLSREEKLSIVKKFGSIVNVPMQELTPNEHGDWIAMRNESFDTFIPMAPEKKFDTKSQSIFITQTLGTVTARDSWVYNFSKSVLKKNVIKTIDHYNEQRQLVNSGVQKEYVPDSKLGSWSRDWQNQIKRNHEMKEDSTQYKLSIYRPFIKTNSYFDDDLNQERYQLPKLFQDERNQNYCILLTGVGASKPFSSLIVSNIPNYDLLEKTNCFPLYFYEANTSEQKGLFDEAGAEDYIRRDGVSDFILERAKKQYNTNDISKEDIFYYVYGFLHSPSYRETFANDLKKMLPRLPLVDDVRDFWAFSKAGRKLADLHLNYETVPAFDGVSVSPFEGGLRGMTDNSKEEDSNKSKGMTDNSKEGDFYKVEKMRFPKKDQKDTIIYNSRITISNIPAEAYKYVVNGKSAIEWIMERYQITTHKDSGIKNDPNDWSAEVGNPRYILDLLLSIINVSVQTVEIVEGLPVVRFE